jgi:pyruvate/2-oxoglutarate dehydrogenase complex dihydrolipoamide dehydrogenase (E3) component
MDVDGLFGSRVFNFHTHEDVFALKAAITEGAKTAVVVGCGFHGIDAALGLKEQGLRVTIIERSLRIMPKFSLQCAHAFLKKLCEQDLEVKLGTRIFRAVKDPKESFALTLSSGEQMSADLVIVATGIIPNTSLLESAGAAVGIDGLVRVDDHMRTTLPQVFACGINVSVPVAVSFDRRWVPEPAVIQRTAHVAGHNAACEILAEYDTIKPVTGTAMLTIGDMCFARTGLNEAEARTTFGDENLLVATVFGTAKESLTYQSEICVKLIVNRATGRVVGGEVYGESKVLPSIDLLSVAVLEGFSPERLIDLDRA